MRGALFIAGALFCALPVRAQQDAEERFRSLAPEKQEELRQRFRELQPEERAARHDMDYHTSFERKKRKLGLPIFRACWSRAPRTT